MSRALSALEGHEADLTPANVMAWYARELPGFEDWRRRFDHVLDQWGDTPDNERGETLCNLLLELIECKTLFRSAGGFQDTIHTIAEQVSHSRERVTTTGRSLKDCQARVDTADSLEAVRPVVSDATDLAAALVQGQEKLTESLRDATEEMAVLRNRLEDSYRQAVSDELTGLGNQRFFEARLRELQEEAQNSGHPLSVALIDIDGFAQFNADKGRENGDRALKLVAGIIRRASRELDVPARTGGDAFGLILWRTGAPTAVDLVNRILDTLSSRPLVLRGDRQPLGRLTMSAGIAETRPGTGVEDLLAAAGSALEQAKEKGGNGVCG